MQQADQARIGLVNDPSKLGVSQIVAEFCVSCSQILLVVMCISQSQFFFRKFSRSLNYFSRLRKLWSTSSICLLCLCNHNKWCQNALEPECLELILNTLKSWSGNWSSQNTLGSQRKNTSLTFSQSFSFTIHHP